MRPTVRQTILPLLLLLLGSGAHPLAAQGTAPIRGDVNGDGKVTALDALAVLSQVVGKALPSGYTVLPNGDADANGQITAVDALIILGYTVGKDVSQYPVGKPIAGPATPAVNMEIAPGSLLIPGVGVTDLLRVRAYDADGRETTVAGVKWRSLDPAVISVAADGRATGAAYGSTRIIAEVPGVGADTILALVAQPAQGAILVADEQVVGNPVAVDTTTLYGVGFRYRVTLTGITPPPVASILIGTGETPIAGRVVAATQSGSQVVVTLEIVPISQAFRQLKIQESLPIEEPSAGSIPQSLAFSASLSSAGLGLSCDASGTGISLTGAPSVEITRSLRMDLDYDLLGGGLRLLVVKGNLRAQASMSPEISVTTKVAAGCKLTVAELPLPVSGFLSVFFGGVVPVGAGFEIEVEQATAKTALEMKAQAQIAMEVGVQCSAAGACAPVRNITSTGSREIKLSPFAIGVRFKVGAFAFHFADLEFGPQLLRRLRVEALSVRDGSEATYEVGAVLDQARDPDYASGFRLADRLHIKAGPGEELTKLAESWGVSLPALEFNDRVPTITSPSGTLAISPGSVAAGDGVKPGQMATFTVTLNSFLGSYMVEEIQIRWLTVDAKGDTIVLYGRPGCTNLVPESVGQRVFTCQADFLPEHAGEQVFTAFVRPQIFGVPFDHPFEIALNSRATVRVDTASVRLSLAPDTLTVLQGDTVATTLTLSGAGTSPATLTSVGSTGLSASFQSPFVAQQTARIASSLTAPVGWGKVGFTATIPPSSSTAEAHIDVRERIDAMYTLTHWSGNPLPYSYPTGRNYTPTINGTTLVCPETRTITGGSALLERLSSGAGKITLVDEAELRWTCPSPYEAYSIGPHEDGETGYDRYVVGFVPGGVTLKLGGAAYGPGTGTLTSDVLDLRFPRAESAGFGWWTFKRVR